MILDNYITFDQKVIVAMISGALWIYLRTEKCYDLLKRKKLLPVILVIGWIYINYYEPLALPLGLSIMLLYAYYNNSNQNI